MEFGKKIALTIKKKVHRPEINPRGALTGSEMVTLSSDRRFGQSPVVAD